MPDLFLLKLCSYKSLRNTRRGAKTMVRCRMRRPGRLKTRLFRFDGAHVACGGQPRSGQAQDHTDADNGEAVSEVEGEHGDAALVEAGQAGDGRPQQVQAVLDEAEREYRAEQPEPEAAPQERPPHEGVACANELGDLDLVTAVLNLEPDRVTD